jgi:hypothetical protein
METIVITAGGPWLTPVILGTQEAEIGGSQFDANYLQ